MSGRRLGAALIVGLAIYLAVKILLAIASIEPQVDPTEALAPTAHDEDNQQALDGSAETPSKQRAEALKLAAGIANNSKGKMMDPETQLLGAEVEGDRILHYQYRFPAAVLRDIDGDFNARVTELLNDRACSQMRSILELGASLRYSYVDRDHQPITAVDIELGQCGNSTLLAETPANSIRICLPGGVSLELPPAWEVFADNERVALDQAVNRLLDLSALESDLSFAANYSDQNSSTIGMMNLRYYPDTSVDQADVADLTIQEIEELDQALENSMRQTLDSMGTPVTYWSGTVRKQVGGMTALVTEYRRKARLSHRYFRVRLVRILAGDRSFTCTVSYLEASTELLAPMTERIIYSLRLERA